MLLLLLLLFLLRFLKTVVLGLLALEVPKDLPPKEREHPKTNQRRRRRRRRRRPPRRPRRPRPRPRLHRRFPQKNENQVRTTFGRMRWSIPKNTAMQW
jgi:hypothetical protein